MSDEHEGYGPQPPGEHELHRAREWVLEADQAGGSRAEVAQAQASARQTEAAGPASPDSASPPRPGLPGRGHRQLRR